MSSRETEPTPGTKRGPTRLELVTYVIAAALLLPVAWWLKANYAEDLGYNILSIGGLLY